MDTLENEEKKTIVLCWKNLEIFTKFPIFPIKNIKKLQFLNKIPECLSLEFKLSNYEEKYKKNQKRKETSSVHTSLNQW